MRPNFLIIITDQWHPRCFSYAGHPIVRTPNIDNLASGGINFSRVYSPQPLCMPTRASLFTGLTPRGHGVRMNGIPLNPSIPTFTAALRQSGYLTYCSGKIHLNSSNTPNDIPLESLDPNKYPESSRLWREGIIKDLPLPYYGLQEIDLCNGHGHGSVGHYETWLKSEHPDKAHLFYDHVECEKSSPAKTLFNRQSYKWALPAELHPTTYIADRTVNFLNNTKEKRGSQPFCAMCSFGDPHSPFAPPAPYCYDYSPADVPPPLSREGELDDLPPHFRAMVEQDVMTSGNKSQAMNATAPYYAECAAHYYGVISLVDEQVGRVMDALRKNELDENTVVIFLADHGEALGDHGLWGKGPYHYDSVIRVPFLINWPGKVDPGTVHAGVCSLLDFAPTVLDIAGVPIPEGELPGSTEAPGAPAPWPGRSLLPVLTGEDKSMDTTALVEMDEDYLGFKMRTLVTERYRLTCYSGQDYGELFDLHEDPDEYFNLWDKPEHQKLRDELRIQLLDKIMQTDISLPRQLSRA